MDKSKSCFTYLGYGSLMILFFTMMICYIIFGIIFLIDNDKYILCSNSHLWIYVLISLIFIPNKLLILVNKIRVFITFIEFVLLIWGSVELFHFECEGHDNDLWLFGIVSFVCQLLSVLSVIISLIYDLNNLICLKKNNRIVPEINLDEFIQIGEI